MLNLDIDGEENKLSPTLAHLVNIFSSISENYRPFFMFHNNLVQGFSNCT